MSGRPELGQQRYNLPPEKLGTTPCKGILSFFQGMEVRGYIRGGYRLTGTVK